MARTSTARLLVAPLALAMLGAPCGTSGPQSRDFAAGAVVIPMDNCYQRRDASSAAGGQTQSCNSAGDEGVFRAYGLVYFLLKKGIPVYWAIDGATPKTTVTALDLDVPAPADGTAVAQKLNWASRQFEAFGAGTGASSTFPANTGIRYLGGPFVVDAADVPTLLTLLQGSDPDIGTAGRVPGLSMIDVHRVTVPFHANQVRPLSGTPPRLAILAINPKPYRKTSFDVMYKYAKAAGFDWSCDGTAASPCAGGLGPSCDAAVVQAYLADTLCSYAFAQNQSCTSTNPAPPNPLPICCDTSSQCAEGCNPNWTANITTARFNPPGTPGVVYDVLCDDDFGNASVTYPGTQLALGGYKLLWAPHWDTGGVDARATGGAGATLGQRLRNIGAFVRAGGNLFAECAAIGALEGGYINSNGTTGDTNDTLLVGVPETQFQTTNGLSSLGSAVDSNQAAVQPFLEPAQPSLQIGDLSFPASGASVNGAITGYYPDRTTASTPASAYRAGVQRLVTATASAPLLDVASTIQVTTADGVAVGTVAYLGGHDYSPAVNGSGGQTAGTRIVLNTLFNLGFGCADPDTTCSTSYPSYSACHTGRLKCNPNAASGFACVPTVQPQDQPEVCGNGIDDNCDGVIDEGCAPVSCLETDPPLACPGGADVCTPGARPCVAGAWSPDCVGRVLKSPEACNGKDDDCNGQVDDGTICPSGVCTNGVCVPAACDLETRCPYKDVAYSCVNAVCVALPCAGNGNAPCPAGTICDASGQCADPCAGVTCLPGSTCSGGACFGGACYTVGCPGAGDICRQGTCVPDPCAGITCADGTFCRDGDCVRSCAVVSCQAGQHCGPDGFCVADCAATCGTGQVCQGGSCVEDPCARGACGIGQACQNGACVDQPCAHVTCPTGATCQDGQCFAPGSGSSATVAKETRTKGGGCGCGSAGGMELLGGLVGVALWPRLRRRRPRRQPGAAGVASLLAVGLAASLGLGGCGKSTKTEVCPAGSTDCGNLCCAAGYACVSGNCVLVTGNPVLTQLSPASAGVGGSVEVTASGDGFLDGAVARYSGAGLSGDAQLTSVSATSGQFTLGLSLATEGTVEVRVVNPGGLISNALNLQVTNAPVPTGLDRTSLAQDLAGPVDLHVVGRSFVSGTVASLSLGGAVQALPTTVVDGTHLTATVADPSALKVGVHDLTVAAPGGGASQSVKLAVVEGTPTLGCITPICVATSTQLVGEATGAWLYPTSTVYARPTSTTASCATVPTPDTCSRLETSCATAAPAANGQCQGGRLSVVIPPAPLAGAYKVEVVNPGAPPKPSAARDFTVGSGCGVPPVCP